MNCIDQAHIPVGQGVNHPQEEHEVKIEYPHIDYYSSDDHCSDSGEESNLLN